MLYMYHIIISNIILKLFNFKHIARHCEQKQAFIQSTIALISYVLHTPDLTSMNMTGYTILFHHECVATAGEVYSSRAPIHKLGFSQVSVLS